MDATTCRRFASAAVTVNISLSSNTNGSDNNCSVTFPPILFTLNNTKILLEISVYGYCNCTSTTTIITN
jgi:hypothetical protein